MYMYEELIDDLVNDIVSWSEFYIVSDEDSRDLAENFQMMLSNHDISYNVVNDASEYDFEEGDCLLAISRTGEDQFIVNVVEQALSKGIKVYGLSNKKDSVLAFLCNELIVIPESHERDVFASVNEKLNRVLGDDHFEVERARIKAPPSHGKRLFTTIILWVILIAIICLIANVLIKYVL